MDGCWIQFLLKRDAIDFSNKHGYDQRILCAGLDSLALRPEGICEGWGVL